MKLIQCCCNDVCLENAPDDDGFNEEQTEKRNQSNRLKKAKKGCSISGTSTVLSTRLFQELPSLTQ